MPGPHSDHRAVQSYGWQHHDLGPGPGQPPASDHFALTSAGALLQEIS